MAKLIYSIQTSLDGFIEDSEGSFEFGFPTPELHQFFNDQLRSSGVHLYGRRLYETMAVWETMGLEELTEDAGDLEPQMIDFAQIWRGVDKIVYSSTLEAVWTSRTELRSEFNADEIRALKESTSADIVVGGAALAASAFKEGLVDEVFTTLYPVTLGAGKPAFPTDQRIELELIDHRRFENGAAHMHYAVK